MGKSLNIRRAFSSPFFTSVENILKYLLTGCLDFNKITVSKQTILLEDYKMTKREMLRNLIKATNSMFFTITWIKKNGEERTMTVKDGVESKLALPKGQGSNNQEAYSNLITLFDVQAGHYKSVNLDTVTKLSCGSKVMWDEGE